MQWLVDLRCDAETEERMSEVRNLPLGATSEGTAFLEVEFVKYVNPRDTAVVWRTVRKGWR